MEIKTLSKNFKVYDLKTINTDIKIYKDNIEKPIVKQKDNFSFLFFENDNTAKIEQMYTTKKNEIELVLPNNLNNEEIIITSARGNITLQNLNLDKLFIFNTNGNIKLEDIDSVFTNIKLIQGDIIAEINESIFNYTTKTKGICEQSTIESINNYQVFLNDKHHLNVNNTEGNIKILFKGKR